MKKLDNKGFAISTMLYGILTMVILVLALLLSIMQGSYNKENIASENITYYLNKCISKQVALEDCYKEYDEDSDNLKSCSDEYETYTSCIGNNVSSTATGSVAYLNQLPVDLADEKDTGLIIDSTETSGTRYIYTGNAPSNYVKFGTKTGRIISIETDGTIKVILTDAYSSKFDTSTSILAVNGESAWINSVVFNLLNNKFNNLEYTDLLTKGKFYTGTITSDIKIGAALSAVKAEATSDYYFGLPTLEDYLKASSNIKSSTDTSSKCDLTSTSTTLTSDTNCSSSNWLKSLTSCMWMMTGIASSDNGNSYVDYYLTGGSSKISKTSPSTTCTAYLVVYFKSTTTVGVDGLGTSASPFVIDLK